MAALRDRFEAAFVGAPSPPRQTPLQRLPPKRPPPVCDRTTDVVARVRTSPVRRMDSHRLMDITNDRDLGVVLASTKLPHETIRVKTNLTTVYIRDDRVVRGRIQKRALYGVQVLRCNPFA